MTIAATLRDLREAQGLTVRQAAKACGLAFRTWYRYESGDTAPSLAHRYAIAAALVHRVKPISG